MTLASINDVRSLTLAPSYGLYALDGELTVSLTHPQGAECLVVNETISDATVDDLCDEPEVLAAIESAMSESANFIDTSPFSGVREFRTPVGVLRFTSEGSAVLSVHKQQGGAFIFDRKISSGARSPRELYAAWADACDDS